MASEVHYAMRQLFEGESCVRSFSVAVVKYQD